MKSKAKNRQRKNFTLKPVSIKALEALSRDMDMSMSRVLEAALDALHEKRSPVTPQNAVIPFNPEKQK